jgi:hypothetical protein
MDNDEYLILKDHLNDIYLLYMFYLETNKLDQMNNYLEKLNKNDLNNLEWYIGEKKYELFDDLTQNIIDENQYTYYNKVYENIQNILNDKINTNGIFRRTK